MEIYLIRHTIPDIKKGICYGQTDLDIADSFYDDLIKIKEKLSTLDDFIVYSSPLKRCSLLANQLSQSPIIDDRLMELHFGDWEMKKWDEINAEELNVWMNDFVNVSCPNGESYIELHRRVSGFLEALKVQNVSKAIIVTHAGVIRSIHSSLNNIQLKDSFDLKVNYGAVLKYEI